MPRKVLIIDDEVNLRESIADYLLILGNDIKLAENGEQGLKVLDEFIPDVIICDLMMPKMDGMEFFSYLKSNNRTFPFILLTARNETAIREKAISIGIVNFITKPFEFTNLIATLESL